MVVDIVIPTYIPTEDDAFYIRSCISSILSNTRKDSYTITCVIDRGWDGTEQLLDSFRAKNWIHNIFRNTAQRGFTRTCNIGLEESQNEYAMLLNTDIVVSPGWLEGLVSCAERNWAGIVGCKLLNTDGSINHAGAFGVGFHRGMNEPNVSYFQEEEVEWVTGAAFLIDKQLRDTIGNLNEYYPMWGSDRDYCLKARAAGFKIVYSPITLLHYGERSTTPEIKEMFKDLPR